MKKALVLAGGGSKGAYQAGVIKALQEMNIRFDGVYGTSIGALNGALVAQNDYGNLYDLWDNISIDQVMNGGIDLDLSIESFLNQKNLVFPFFKQYLGRKGADNTPLIEMVHRLCSEAALISVWSASNTPH